MLHLNQYSLLMADNLFMSDSSPISAKVPASQSQPQNSVRDVPSSHAEVSVKQVSSEQINVSYANQSKHVPVPTNDLQGQLEPKSRYLLSVTTRAANQNVDASVEISNQSTSLNKSLNGSSQGTGSYQQATTATILEFTKVTSGTLSNIDISKTISESQLEKLLSLPPNQLQAAKIPPSLLTARAQVVSNTGNQLTLSFQETPRQQPANVSISVPELNSQAVGAILALKLKPMGGQWQVLVTPNASALTYSAASMSNEQVTPLLKQILTGNEARVGATQMQLSNALPPAPQFIIDSKLLLRTLTSASSHSADVSYSRLPATQTTLPLAKNEGNALLDILKNAPPSKVQLSITTSGESITLNARTLATESAAPSAQMTINQHNIKEVFELIKGLNLRVPANAQRALIDISDSVNLQSANKELGKLESQDKNSNVVNSKDPSSASRSLNIAAVREGFSRFINSFNNDKAVNLNPPITAEAKVAQNTISNIVAPSITPNMKSQAIDVLHSLLRVVQAKAQEPSESLARITTALNDTQYSDEPVVKNLKDELLAQIKQGIPQGKEQDVNQIRQLITNQPLSLSSTQIISPVSGQGMLSGLVTLIQISLASRLARNQPNQGEKLSKALTSLLSAESSAFSTSKTSSRPTLNVKGLTEFAQLEQKHQILREIGRLFAGHQNSKIGNAEQFLQGQDSFYYTLPSAFGNKLQDIEMLIRRENDPRGDEQDADNKANKSWQLTMKLSAGELGELLTKGKLFQGTLELDFYTSNEQTKHQVMNYLPLFKKRLTALGIEITRTQCQLGKIPDSLRQRPYHLLQTKV